MEALKIAVHLQLRLRSVVCRRCPVPEPQRISAQNILPATFCRWYYRQSSFTFCAWFR